MPALFTPDRSNSIYRSFSALTALIHFTVTDGVSYGGSVYSSFAADGCIFHLDILAHTLGDSCVEKEYLLALVDLGREISVPKARADFFVFENQRFADILRTDLLHLVSLQRYVSSSPQKCDLKFFPGNIAMYLSLLR